MRTVSEVCRLEDQTFWVRETRDRLFVIYRHVYRTCFYPFAAFRDKKGLWTGGGAGFMVSPQPPLG